MNYELAKQLKDAGYDYGWFYLNNDTENPINLPTLEELIEACRLFNHDYDILVESLRDDRYYAGARLFGYTDANANGQTATEAVAMLYLALYGNKQDFKKGSETSCVEGK